MKNEMEARADNLTMWPVQKSRFRGLYNSNTARGAPAVLGGQDRHKSAVRWTKKNLYNCIACNKSFQGSGVSARESSSSSPLSSDRIIGTR
jgi:hypothetical protein